MIAITLQSEYVFSVFGFLVTNTFLTSVTVTILLSLAGGLFYLHRTNERSTNPFLRGWHILVFELLKLTDSVTGDRTLSKRVLPLITTLFFFIVSANLIALVPGFLGSFFVHTEHGNVPLFRSPNSDLTTTLALAIFTVVSIQYFSVKSLGIKQYIKRFVNFSNPIQFILGFFEILSESVKVLSFSFRLFGNIFAGEVLLLITAFLIPYIIPLPFMILEVFVGIIQAFIFSMLALTFIKTTTIRHIRSRG